MKEDLIKKLVDTFKVEAEKYSNQLEGVVNYKCEEFFRKNNPAKGYHSVDASIMFKNFVLKLEYKINISALLPKSTIEMRFMFENGKLPVEFSIYDLLNVIQPNDFKCYTFSYITTEYKMKEVLEYLVDTFRGYKEEIEKTSQNAENIKVLENLVEEKIKLFLREDILKSRNAFYLMHMLEWYYVLDISRFTAASYINYTTGEYNKSIKGYKKLKGKLTDYEQRLVEHMKLNSHEIQTPVRDDMNTLAKAMKLKNAKTGLVAMCLAWIVLMPIWCTIYDLVYNIARYFFSKDAVYVVYELPIIIFFTAFITAMVHTYFTRRIVYKLLFKKKYNEIKALEEIQHNEKREQFINKLLQFVIAASLVFAVLIANTNMTFFKGHFKDNSNLLDIKGTEYNYKDVYCVYKANGALNNLGEVVNNPTYVIVLKGGTQINLYNIATFEDIKQNIIPILENQNIEIREIDLIDNIEQDLNK